MSLQALVPANSKSAMTVAVNAFKRFLAAEHVALEKVTIMIQGDPSGATLITVMDKFAMYLAFERGPSGDYLKANSVLSYYRQVKKWVLNEFKQLKTATDEKLLEMARTLERHCVSRDNGTMVNKGPACTKMDLSCLMRYLYSTATCSTDYEDAALLCLMCHVFGRASDLSLVSKAGLSVSASSVLFLRLVRVKTAEEQGLSLFPDRDSIFTCPVFAVAMALMMQPAPSAALLTQLPASSIQVDRDALSSVPLLELLNVCGTSAQPSLERTSTPAAVSRAPGVHSYVNRVLKRISPKAGTSNALTSHSFRRGGAQHANGDPELSAQWIFDRGAWNMASTNKAFAYVFNTTAEDQRISRVLSGWKSNDEAVLPELSTFDSLERNAIDRVQVRLFTSCTGIGTPGCNVDSRVLELCTASVLRHYPRLKELAARSPAVVRIEESVEAAGRTTDDLVRWSMRLSTKSNATRSPQCSSDKTSNSTQDTLEYQVAVITSLIDINKRWEERFETLVATLGKRNVADILQSKSQEQRMREPCETAEPHRKRQKKPSPAHLRSVWFEWFTREPRMWMSGASRQAISDARHIVAFMQLFVDGGFVIDEGDTEFKTRVHELGQQAETATLDFLRARGVRATGATSVLKHLRAAHKDGALDSHIDRFSALRASGAIVDPTPLSGQDVLKARSK